MIQTKNKTKIQFQELQQRIQQTFTNILNDTFYNKSEQIKTCFELNNDISDFILKFNFDQQIEMALNFIRTCKSQLQNYIKDNIIPQINQANSNYDLEEYQKIANFIDIYQQFTKKYNWLLTSVYSAVNLLYQNNPQLTLKNFLNYFFLEQLYSSNIQDKLFKIAISQLDIAYKLIQNPQDFSWKNISFVLQVLENVLNSLQLDQENFLIKNEFTQKVHDYFQNRYQEKYNQWSLQFTTPTYLRKVQMEKQFNFKILNFKDSLLLQQINTLLDKYLLLEYKEYFLSNTNPQNFQYFLDSYSYENKEIFNNLEIIYELYIFEQQNNIDINLKFQQNIVSQGKLILQLINNQKITKQLAYRIINSIHNLYKKYKQIVELCFKNNITFISNIISAFEELINLKIENYKFHEYLVLFIETEIENNLNKQIEKNTLEEVISLFQFIPQDQNFILYYKNRLAFRLLNYYRSLLPYDFHEIYLKTESLLINKITMLQGIDNLQSLFQMIEDVQNSNDTIFEVQKSHKQDFLICNPLLLRLQNWPEFQQLDIKISYEFKNIVKFKQQFESQQENKCIKWVDWLSYFEIEYSRNNKLRFLLNSCQAMILLAYQYKNQFMSIKMISQTTNIEEHLIEQNCSLMQIQKILEVRKQQDDEFYRFNESWFHLKETLLISANTHIPVIQLQQEKSNRNLNIALEALIVKILKAQKTILYQDLVQIIQQWFKNSMNEFVDHFLIKKTLEYLQNQEYLKRNQSNPDLLEYVS